MSTAPTPPQPPDGIYEVDEFMLVAAFRYALGRMSTAPSHVATQLRAHWPRLNDWTRQQIQREIKEAIRLGDAGMECDVATWSGLLELPVDAIRIS